MGQTYPASTVEAQPVVKVQRLDSSVPLPDYAHHGDAGADLASAESVTLKPGQRHLVGTGLAIELPAGYVGLIHPRSGLAHRHGISIVNAPGTIDSGYRGEIKINLINLDPEHEVTLNPGDRVGQLVIQEVAHVRFHEVESLEETPRGTAGHGSTGGFGPVEVPHA